MRFLTELFLARSVREFRTALIGIPALLMAAWMIFGMWRDGGQEVRRRREGIKPWGQNVAKYLPKLAPLAAAAAAAAAARASVKLAVSWPVTEIGAGRGRAGTGFVSPFVRARKRKSEVAGVVALPPECVAQPRQATERRRERIPSDWKLVVNPRI